MASYPKIWTTIMYEDWFVEMSGLERGVYLQMLLLCKIQGDTGTISYRNWTHLAHDLGINRKSLSRIVSVFTTSGRIFTHQNYSGTISITVPKYLEYQGLTKGSDVDDKRRDAGKIGHLELNRTELKQAELKQGDGGGFEYEPFVRKIYDQLHFSDWNHLVKQPNPMGWIRGLLKSYGPEKVEQTITDIIQFYKARGVPVPNQFNGRVKVDEWCKRPKVESQDEARRKAIETWEPEE